MLNNVEDRPNTNHAPSLRLAILADDLTGACDAAAPFAMHGLRTEVGVAKNASPSSACDVWSCSTESRDADATSVEHALARHLFNLPPAGVLFNKIDSVFRGNTVAEIAAMRRLRPNRLALLAPAFPQAGRIVHDGVLKVCDVAGARTLPLFAVLREQGLEVRQLAASSSTHELRSTLEDHAASTGTLLLCDAQSQQHLDTLVEAANDVLADPLWIGSAGLAHALAKSLGPTVSIKDPEDRAPLDTARTVLMFIGSTHAVTRAQVDAIALQRSQHAHVRIIAVPRGASARDCVLDAILGFEPQEIGCLFVTGGDTASLVLAALGITSLQVVDEFAVGLPRCVAIGGRFHGVPVLLKSGGFGETTVLCDIAESFRPAHAEAGRSSL